MKKHRLKLLVALGVLSITSTALAYTYSTQVTLAFAGDVGTSANTGTLVIGNSSGRQVALDDNEIQARSPGGGATTLYLQHGGGNLAIGAPNISLEMTADIEAAGTPAIGFSALSSGELILELKAPFVRAWDRLWVEGSLEVFGDLYLKSEPVSGGVPACLGSGGRVGKCSSSELYKTNISPIRYGLSAVMAMQPVDFVWKEGSVPDVGFVAEQADNVLPELAVRDKAGNTQGFNYQHYTAVLTRAVQEQQATIEAQRAELAALKEAVAGFSRELAALKASDRAL
jgi:hypothetical protein